jgi:excisionase family DNA binding protein
MVGCLSVRRLSTDCVSTKTVRRWITSGDLAGYRAGKRLIRVDLNELDALLRPFPTAGGGTDAA